jgi:SAM-dependent methyltransferase
MTRLDLEPDPLDNLGYFVEWGGRPWTRLTAFALREFTGTDLAGQRVLEIGTRYGKMACLFALLGADVVGVDISSKALEVARAEVDRWGVADRVTLVQYSGNLDLFARESFDIVFSKSVLVLVKPLDSFLAQIGPLLKPDGKIVFIENGKGNRLLHAVRRLRHRSWDYTRADYFTQAHLKLVGSMFAISGIKKSLIPPICLIMGHRAG